MEIKHVEELVLLRRVIQKYFAFSFLLPLSCAAPGSDLTQVSGSLSAPTYVQGASATPQSTMTSVSCAFSSAERAGDLVVVFAGWNDSVTNISSVTDSLHNTYTRAIGPTRELGSATQSAYYALDVAGGGNTVTVAFGGRAPFVDLRVAEYSGLEVFDRAVGSSGSSGSSSSSPLTGVGAGELLVASDYIGTASTGFESGWSERLVTKPDSDLLEDDVPAQAGSYAASASMSPDGWWVMQMLAFKAAGSGDGGVDGGAGGGGAAGNADGAAGAGRQEAGADAAGAGGQSRADAGGSGGNIFPLSAAAGGRFLQDGEGNPFPILGRTAWNIVSLPAADAATFIADSVSKGYDAFEFAALWRDSRAANVPFDGDGDAPFLKTLGGADWDGNLSYSDIDVDGPDFSTPNPAFWNAVAGLVDNLAAHGAAALMFPAYLGYHGEEAQGWMGEVVANGPSRMRAYGTYLGNLFATRPNVVWMAGGDIGTSTSFTSAQQAAESALITGIKSVVGAAPFWSAEWDSESIATDQANFGAAMTLDGAYSWTGATIGQGRRAYTRSPIEPAFLLEEPYDEEGPDGNDFNPNAIQPVRRFQWWGWLSVIGGYLSGNGYVWPFSPGVWEQHLDTQGAGDMAHLNAFIRSVAWQALVPDGFGARALVTAGLGSGDGSGSSTTVTAAADPSGTLLVAYVPPGHPGSFTVDLTNLSGQATARWFNPATGAYTPIGSLPNTGSHTFDVPGDNGTGFADWTLVLSVP